MEIQKKRKLNKGMEGVQEEYTKRKEGMCK